MEPQIIKIRLIIKIYQCECACGSKYPDVAQVRNVDEVKVVALEKDIGAHEEVFKPAHLKWVSWGEGSGEVVVVRVWAVAAAGGREVQ